MDSVSRGAKRSAAALALGLGLTVAAGPGIAWAEDAEAPAADKPAAGQSLSDFSSAVDKAAKKGLIHKNKASNLKRKAARVLATLA